MGASPSRAAASDDPAKDDAVSADTTAAAVQASAPADLATAGALIPASQQVAAALSSLADAAPTEINGSAQAATAPATPAALTTPGAIRTTPDGGREAVIKLDPEHLGSVAIRLKMTGGTIEVAITVSDAHTLDLLERDRHVLTAAVSAAGLGGSGVALTHGAAAPTSTAQSFSQGGADTGSRQAPDRDAAASGDPSGERRRNGRNDTPTTSRGPALDDTVLPPAAVRAGELYV